ncbi:MAG: protein-L-isoaspartate(D-aspartate) O-methyltransferase [Agriterribacter sp.]
MERHPTNRRDPLHHYYDSEKQVRLRQRLTADIAAKGISDERVLDAIRTLPRHLFMPSNMADKAYEDKAFPIGEGQTISQPYTVAYQTQLLQVQPGNKVLEVGTGSAYQAAILAVMGAEVYTIERQKKLYERNLKFSFLKTLPSLHCSYGDGFSGWPSEAPFDRILITAAPEQLPPALVAQLREGGLLVAPVGRLGLQRMVRVTKKAGGELQEEVFDYFAFVPMLKGRV